MPQRSPPNRCHTFLEKDYVYSEKFHRQEQPAKPHFVKARNSKSRPKIKQALSLIDQQGKLGQSHTCQHLPNRLAGGVLWECGRYLHNFSRELWTALSFQFHHPRVPGTEGTLILKSLEISLGLKSQHSSFKSLGWM